MPDLNGMLSSAIRTTQQGQVYLNIKVVASDLPPTNAKTPRDANGALDSSNDAATTSIKAVGV